MAEKKYVDLTGLTTYDGKIKALIDDKDATALQAAKDYADGLAGNYDKAGTAATKVQELADGQVKANKEAIAKLNGDATTDGSVAKAVADAKTALEGKITAVEGKADVNHTHTEYASTSHNHDSSYYKKSDVDSKLNAKADSSTLTSHTGNADVHVTSAKKTNWDAAYTHSQSTHAPSGAEANQNAFSKVKVGNSTISSGAKTDTLTMIAGNNVTLTPKYRWQVCDNCIQGYGVYASYRRWQQACPCWRCERTGSSLVF